MNSLINGDSRSSRSIVDIARELRTSTAYLLGKVDDPTIDAPTPPDLPVQDRRLVAAAETLKSAERAFILEMLETLQQKRTTAPDTLGLPAEEILTAMFQGMFDQIDALDPALSRDEQARLLAPSRCRGPKVHTSFQTRPHRKNILKMPPRSITQSSIDRATHLARRTV
jgi:hypothetical protein